MQEIRKFNTPPAPHGDMPWPPQRLPRPPSMITECSSLLLVALACGVCVCVCCMPRK
ncbi:uncharacterized protein F4812DRAFT_417955 [Daldinia caldariorum]|uniref:uncharacterized protein n=1 Tax=Daldinia caldariorum TaxID=326644 RepID=UPI002007CFAA|nr:uncharacterized protein F4812DRAFT_417955 [Daldinia caldariorum]KAI1470520.1 hypothetical protein F4812DRAFT_417955 [Daldinia caldariorum]